MKMRAVKKTETETLKKSNNDWQFTNWTEFGSVEFTN